MDHEHNIALLRSKLSTGDFAVRRELGLALKNHGDALTQLGGQENLAKAAGLCEEAIALLGDQPPAENGSDRDELASAWMKRGIALLNMGRPDTLAKAIGCFDKAIELRRSLPLENNPIFRYGLAAGWMNRGDALTRLGPGENLTEAVRSYDEALVHLRPLPLENTLFQKRLAIAWMNRGITLQAQNTPESLTEAVQSFDNTIAALGSPAVEERPENHPILACAWMNRGNALLGVIPSQAGPARLAAKHALSLATDAEEQDLIAAETGFKARHILCRAIADLLAESTTPETEQKELYEEATDAVEDGMKLARRWESRGVIFFRPITNDLFRFGAHAYQAHQPHFLVEFLLESLEPENSSATLPDNEEMLAYAIAVLSETLHREGFQSLNTPRFNLLLETLRRLRVSEARLRELRQHQASATGGAAQPIST